MADIINTIQTKVLGEAEIARLTALIEAQVTSFLNLSNSMKAAGASEAQILASTRGHAQQIKKLGDEVAATEKKIAGAKGLGGSQGLLILGQGVQDFEAAGMRGITNQIDQFAQALGVGAGLAGILTIAGVAIQVFLPQIQALIASFRGEDLTKFAGHLEGVSARIKELKEKASTGAATAPELLELRSLGGQEKRLKAGGATFEKLTEAKTEEEEDIGKEVSAQFTTPRGRLALQELARRRAKPGASTTAQGLKTQIDEIDAQIKKFGPGDVTALGGPVAGLMGKTGTAEGLRAKRSRLQGELDAANILAETTAQQDLGAIINEAASTDPTKTGKIAADLKAAGFADVAAKVAGAPATVQQKAQAKAVEEEDKKVWKPIWDKMVADEKKTHNQEVGALEAQGKIYEDMGKEDVKRDVKRDEKKAEFDAKLGKDWQSLDKKLEGVKEKDFEKRAGQMVKDHMKETMRDPKMFSGMEQFLISVQEAGLGKDRDREQELMQDMVMYLKLMSESNQATEADWGPGLGST